MSGENCNDFCEYQLQWVYQPNGHNLLDFPVCLAILSHLLSGTGVSDLLSGKGMFCITFPISPIAIACGLRDWLSGFSDFLSEVSFASTLLKSLLQ